MRCKTEFMLCLCGVYRMTHLRQMNAPGSGYWLPAAILRVTVKPFTVIR